jgi:hypothetical protein
VLMSHLPPSGWSDVVRTSDLDLRLAVVESRFDAVDARFETLEARVDARLHQLSNQLTARIAALVGLVIAVDVLLSRL